MSDEITSYHGKIMCVSNKEFVRVRQKRNHAQNQNHARKIDHKISHLRLQNDAHSIAKSPGCDHELTQMMADVQVNVDDWKWGLDCPIAMDLCANRGQFFCKWLQYLILMANLCILFHKFSSNIIQISFRYQLCL